MGNYLFKPENTFLNRLFFGPDVGNRLVSPELQQVIATNQTRDAVVALEKIELASLYGQRESIAIQRESHQELQRINSGVESLSSAVSTGVDSISERLDSLSVDLRGGFDDLGDKIDLLADGMRDGFEQLGTGLRTGFEAVVKSLYHVDERIGERLVAGFSSTQREMRRQNRVTVGTLINGFGFLGDAIDQATNRTVASMESAAANQINAMKMAAEAQVAAIRSAAKAQGAAIDDAANRISMAVVASSCLQANVVLAVHRQLAVQLGEMSDLMRNPDAVRCVERFVVGMNFVNNRDFLRAKQELGKARKIFAGHFPTLFAYGFCCRILNEHSEARDSFEAALSQTDADVRRAARQRSVAALYLGRLAFDQQEYDQARHWFHRAYRQNHRAWSALVEGAASLLLASNRPDRQADARAIKTEFNQFGNSQYERFGPPAHVLWYCMALQLAPLAPGLAGDAFRHGAYGDIRVRDRNRVALVALLWELNPRTAGMLLDIVKDEFPWM